MKQKRTLRCMIFILAAALLMGGCSALPQKQAAQSGVEESVVSGRMVLVDPEESSSDAPYRPESPPAEKDDAITEGQTAPASVTSTSESSASPLSASSEPASKAESAQPSSAPPESQAESVQPSSTAPPPQGEAASSAASGTSYMVGSANTRKISVSGEVRGVWISYLELNNLMKGKSKAQFTANIQAVFDSCKSYGLNTVVVHVRPFADAIYPSEYFPWSYLCTGTEGVDPGYDPLAVMVDEAHARGLRFEAWVNPYRVRAADSKNELAASNQAAKWLNAGDSAVIRHNGVISYNPASPKAQELIVNGVRELVANYPVDAVHIDDYFYPTTDASFDAASYTAYLNGGGKLSQADWRRRNVETLLLAMYAGIKAENPDVLFGISPQSSVYNNYNAMYLDVAKVTANPGYCDYICPQIYFGYQNDAQPYLKTLEAWENMVNADYVSLYVGVAAYKAGALDNWAGNGKNEWLQNSDLLKRMVESARGQSTYSGFVVYRYDSLFNPASGVAAHVDKEYKNLRDILN